MIYYLFHTHIAFSLARLIFMMNLISINSLCEIGLNIILSCSVQDPQSDQTIGRAHRRGRLYYLDFLCLCQQQFESQSCWRSFICGRSVTQMPRSYLRVMSKAYFIVELLDKFFLFYLYVQTVSWQNTYLLIIVYPRSLIFFIGFILTSGAQLQFHLGRVFILCQLC